MSSGSNDESVYCAYCGGRLEKGGSKDFPFCKKCVNTKKEGQEAFCPVCSGPLVDFGPSPLEPGMNEIGCKKPDHERIYIRPTLLPPRSSYTYSRRRFGYDKYYCYRPARFCRFCGGELAPEGIAEELTEHKDCEAKANRKNTYFCTDCGRELVAIYHNCGYRVGRYIIHACPAGHNEKYVASHVDYPSNNPRATWYETQEVRGLYRDNIRLHPEIIEEGIDGWMVNGGFAGHLTSLVERLTKEETSKVWRRDDGEEWWTDDFSGLGTSGGVSVLPNGEVLVPNVEGAVYRFNGDSWIGSVTDTCIDMVSISAIDERHVWAAGIYGTIFFHDGRDWHCMETPVNKILYCISALDESHVWAVGAAGTVLAWDGKDWTRQKSGTRADLTGVHALDAGHVWAVGDDGTVLFFDGERWSRRKSGLNGHIHAVHALDERNIWAVGDRSVYRCDGESWETVVTFENCRFFAVYAQGPESIWIAGDACDNQLGHFGVVGRYDGHDWRLTRFAEAGTFLSLAAGGGRLWAASENSIYSSALP